MARPLDSIALTLPTWYDCQTPEEASALRADLRTWRGIMGVERTADWDRAVLQAMARQHGLWSRLAVHHALDALKDRGIALVPLDATGHAQAPAALGLPDWLVDLERAVRLNLAGREQETARLHQWQARVMGPRGIHAVREEAAGAGHPTVHGIRLPAALLLHARRFLHIPRFTRADGKPLRRKPLDQAIESARRLRGLLKWASDDLEGPERTGALAVGWAAAGWFMDHGIPLKATVAGAEEARGHWKTALVLAEKLMARHEIRTPADRQAAALSALEGPWDPDLKAAAAETLAMAWSPRWEAGGERVWAQGMAVLAGRPETHWVHGPTADPRFERHLKREGIDAAIAHLATGVAPGAVLEALRAHLAPTDQAELLAQVWLSTEAHPVARAPWETVVRAWLETAPIDAREAWVPAVSANHRDPMDGDPAARIAQAKGMVLETRLAPAGLPRRAGPRL